MADSNPVDWDSLGIQTTLNVPNVDPLEDVEDLKDVNLDMLVDLDDPEETAQTAILPGSDGLAQSAGFSHNMDFSNLPQQNQVQQIQHQQSQLQQSVPQPQEDLLLQHQEFQVFPYLQLQQQQQLFLQQQQSYNYSTTTSETSYSACPTPIPADYVNSSHSPAPARSHTGTVSPAPSGTYPASSGFHDPVSSSFYEPVSGAPFQVASSVASAFSTSTPKSAVGTTVPITVPGIELFSGKYGFEVDFAALSGGVQKKSKEWTYSPKVEKLFCRPEKAVPLLYRTKSPPPKDAIIRARVLFRDVEYKKEDVLRCRNHSQTPSPTLVNNNHNDLTNISEFFINADHPEAVYHYPDRFGRHSVSSAFKSPEPGAEFSELCVRFMCSSTCCKPSVSRRQILLVVTLEDAAEGTDAAAAAGSSSTAAASSSTAAASSFTAAASSTSAATTSSAAEEREVLGRMVVGVAIITCPGRDRKKAEQAWEQNEARKLEEGEEKSREKTTPTKGKKRLIKSGLADETVPPPGKRFLKNIKIEPEENPAPLNSRPPSHATTASVASMSSAAETATSHIEDDDDDLGIIVVKGKRKWEELKRYKELLDIKYALNEDDRQKILQHEQDLETPLLNKLQRELQRASRNEELPRQQQQQQQQQRKDLPKKPRKSPQNSASSLHDFFGVR